MKMVITENDVYKLTGKFIIQLDTDKPDQTLTDENWSFFKDKRITFISGLKWCGFYYEHQNFESKEDFVEYFNNYVYLNSDKKETGKIFHRLLSSKELDFVLSKMKEENY